MWHSWMSKTSLAASAGLMSMAAMFAAPAQADPIDDSFLSALGGSGVNVVDPGSATALGQSVCPMLVQPAGSIASAASALTGSNGGMSPEMADLFARVAVSVYCPQMMSQAVQGQVPTLPQIPGVPGLSGLSGIPGL